MTKWPIRLSCYGRKYEAHTPEQLTELTGHLIEGRIALANRYRVGGSWPRGKKGQPQVKAQVSAPKTIARCDKCGRGYIWYRNLDQPCPYPPPGSRPSKENPLPPCGGRVVLLDKPQAADAVDPVAGESTS